MLKLMTKEKPEASKPPSAANSLPENPAFSEVESGGFEPEKSYGDLIWLRAIAQKVKGAFGGRRGSLKESLEEVIDEHDAAGEIIDSEEKTLLRNVLVFSELSVGDIMIPRLDIVAIEHDANLTALQALVIEKEHTRIPIYRESLDEVLGFVHVKDLFPYLRGDKKFNLKTIIREVLFVPPSMKLSDLLVDMRVSRVHMAIVIDEYGGTCGLITMEDLMEEIVGEIQDEHDELDESFMRDMPDGSIETSARVSLEELSEKLGISFDKTVEEEIDTLGGLIVSMLGRVPHIGETVTYSESIAFEIKDADPRRIKRVLILRIPQIEPTLPS